MSGTDVAGVTYDGDDWCAEDLGARAVTDCALRPLTVRGAVWRGVSLRGARPTGLDLAGAARPADAHAASVQP